MKTLHSDREPVTTPEPEKVNTPIDLSTGNPDPVVIPAPEKSNSKLWVWILVVVIILITALVIKNYLDRKKAAQNG
jgi:hypothetical protein